MIYKQSIPDKKIKSKLNTIYTFCMWMVSNITLITIFTLISLLVMHFQRVFLLQLLPF